jgi:hypothetical protein
MSAQILIINELNDYINGKSYSINEIIKYITDKHEFLLCSFEKINDESTYVLIRYVNGSEDHLSSIEEECRSVLTIYKNNKFELVYALFNRIRTNEEAFKYIEEKKISNDDIKYEYCYEGTLFAMFWCEYTNKWRFHTRSCLDAEKSYWNKQYTYGKLISESLKKNNITLVDLSKTEHDFFEKKYYYIMALIDVNNQNIISYESKFGKNYSKVLFISKRKFGSITDEKINENGVKTIGFIISKKYQFDTLEDAKKYINKKDRKMDKEGKMNREGLVMKIYNKDKKSNIIMKLQTERYKKIKSMKPNVYNKWIMYLVLYQTNKLREYLEFFPNLNSLIIRVTHTTFTTFRDELFRLYHETRNKQNPTVYDLLPPIYKKVMYDIHGIFLKKRESKLSEKNGVIQKDVDNYLRSIDGQLLNELILARQKLIEKLDKNNNSHLINRNCNDINYLTIQLNSECVQKN